MSLLPDSISSSVKELENCSILIHGAPKIGKTTLAAGFDDNLILQFEAGAGHVKCAKTGIITSWEMLLSILAEVATTPKGQKFKVITADTLDQMYVLCREYICKKHGVDHEQDKAFGRVSTEVNREFLRVLSKIASLKADSKDTRADAPHRGFIMITHTVIKELETNKGKKMSKRVMTLPDKVAADVAAMADIIIYGMVSEDGEHIIRTKKSEDYESGSRLELPDPLPLKYSALRKAYEEAKSKKKEE